MFNKGFQAIKSLGWRRGVMLLALMLVLGFTGLHTLRLMRHLEYGQFQRDEDIHGWMTIGYIAHSYRVPPQHLQQALGLPEFPPDKRPLVKIASGQHRSLEALKGILEEAIIQARALPEDRP